MGVDASIVAPESGIPLAILEFGDVFIVACPAIEDSDPVLDCDQNSILGIDSLDISRDPDRTIELSGVERVRASIEREAMKSFIDNI